jgi:hypothetical protein
MRIEFSWRFPSDENICETLVEGNVMDINRTVCAKLDMQSTP